MQSHNPTGKFQVNKVVVLFLCMSAIALPVFSQSALSNKRRGRNPNAAKSVPKSDTTHLYPVLRDGPDRTYEYGFIDNTGKLVIDFDKLPKTTRNVGEFHDGLALIYLEDQKSYKTKMGYFDRRGKIVIAARFDYARDFSEGLAYVESKTFHGFIDRLGKIVINLDQHAAEFGTTLEGLGAKDFHDGRAAVGTGRWQDYQLSRDDSNMWIGRWGYIDPSRRLVVQPLYKFADNFSDGRAGVVVSEKSYESEPKFGFINKDGEMVVKPQFRPRKGGPHHFGVGGTSIFHDGLARVNPIDGLVGFINTKGEFVVPPTLTEATDFSDGYAWGYTNNLESGTVTRVGLLDTSGNWISIDLTAGKDSHHVRVIFTEGLAAVPLETLQDGTVLWGYVDRKGVAEVSLKESWLGAKVEFINKQGQFIWRSK